MTDEELRELVREAVARHLRRTPPRPRRPRLPAGMPATGCFRFCAGATATAPA